MNNKARVSRLEGKIHVKPVAKMRALSPSLQRLLLSFGYDGPFGPHPVLGPPSSRLLRLVEEIIQEGRGKDEKE